MKNVIRNEERGIALFFSIFALLLLTGIAAALVLMANTETSVNSNYRQEQVAYLAAKAGIEEARARMMPSDPNTINVGGTALPTAAPTNTNGQIIYIVNPGKGSAVQPWNSGNPWPDDELCHDYNGGGLGLTTVAPNVRCATTTLGVNAYLASTSQLPFSTTATPVPYKWVRIAPKVNGSILGPGTTILPTSTYSVNPTLAGTATFPVCWDGVNEWVLTKTSCQQMNSVNSTYMNNVYILTALGVSSDAPNAARKVLQAEVALNPTSPFPYGLFATSNACPAITFTGNNPSTDSYTTANNGTYASTKTPTGGDVGSNGEVSVGNGNVGGIVGALQPPPLGPGTCPTPVVVGPNGSTLGTSYSPQPYVFPTPPAPNPLPPTSSYSPPSCGGGKKSGSCMVPGSYGNISITGTLTLAPGTYTINSLSMTGNGAIVVNPPGAITLNVAGQGNSNPLAIAGNGITDDTIPNDFTINYAGTGTISIAGNGDVTAILNAPNANITQQGNGNWYGSILGSTVTIGGNAFFHFDKNAALAPPNNGYFSLVSFREVSY